MKHIFLLSFFLFLMIGCSSAPKPNTDGISASGLLTMVSPVYEEQTKEIKTASVKIDDNLLSIFDSGEDILNIIASSNVEWSGFDEIEIKTKKIQKESINAQKDLVRIQEALEDLEQTNNILGDAQNKVKKLEEEIDKLSVEERELRAEGLREIRKFVTMFFVAGFAILAGGIFVLFWVNKRMGTVIVGVGIITLGLAAASQYYLELIAQLGLWALGIGTIIIIGMWVKELYSSERKKNAITEIIELIEAMKLYLTEEERQKIFGKNGIAARMQSEFTKVIVSKIKIKNGFKNFTEIEKTIMNEKKTTDS